VWQTFINKIDFVQAMPYHLSQDLARLLYKQTYLSGEVVYDVGDIECDTLYFVLQGKLKVETHVTISQDITYPVEKFKWEKQTKTTQVHYYIKTLQPSSYFGLEELLEIGC